jgi:hypothetical protein
VHGRLELARGYFRTPGLPFPLRDAVGTVELAGDKAVLRSLAGRFGGGRVEASGEVGLVPGQPLDLSLEVQGTGVRLLLFGGLQVRADPELTYVAERGRRSLHGTLHVTHARYRPSDLRPELALGQGTAFLQGLGDTDLKVTVEAPGNLWLETPDAELEGEARLVIGGTSSDPVVLGTINYLGQTKLRLQGRPYTVNRGQLIFDNPFSIDPRLDFEAETRLPSYQVILSVTGTLAEPKVVASSDPPLPTGDILAVLLGSDPQSTGGNTREADRRCSTRAPSARPSAGCPGGWSATTRWRSPDAPARASCCRWPSRSRARSTPPSASRSTRRARRWSSSTGGPSPPTRCRSPATSTRPTAATPPTRGASAGRTPRATIPWCRRWRSSA